MKTMIAAVCLVALAGIGLLIVTSTEAEAGKNEPVQLSALPEAASPGDGQAEQYAKLYDLRMKRIDDLERYAALGNFPQNTYSGRSFTPVFIDRQGTPCAVAYLMETSGATALAEMIANTDRFVKLYEVDSGPAVEWMLTSGLTKEECELIQPSYRKEPPGENLIPARHPNPDVARMCIQHHLQSTARMLRKDTPASLALALRRLDNATPGEFEILDPQAPATRVFRNDGKAAMLVRLSVLDPQGKLTAKGAWHELAPGAGFTIDKKWNGSRCLLETRNAPAAA